jgi:hypothetical protein
LKNKKAKKAKPIMPSTSQYPWTFRNRFRRHAFGWRSQTAIDRIKEAILEIKAVARKDPVLGGDGAVLFLEKISSAIEQVDSSSGAIGTAVNNAIETLVPIIATAPVDDKKRDLWLRRLWEAIESDHIPYLETVPDHWGVLCASLEHASHWADQFMESVRSAWESDSNRHGVYKETAACLSALYKAGRYIEIMALIERISIPFWSYRVWGVRALHSMGKTAEALRFAEESRGLNQPDVLISEACEEILLTSSMMDEAYRRYAIEANQKTTYLGTFRAIIKKYPKKKPEDILNDLIASTPGDEGKWFAAAKSQGLYDEAIKLANRTPCDPKTLTRAARDMHETKPQFAIEAGMAALRWLVEGYGYDITGLDVLYAYDYTMKAAKNEGISTETLERIRKLVQKERFGDRFVTKFLGPKIGLQ